MVFMRPRVSRNAEQDREVLEHVYRKSPLVEQWDREGQRPAQLDKKGQPVKNPDREQK
jgi:hypothetical protein